MNLSHDLPTVMTWGGKTLKLNLAFDVILRLFDLQRDKLFAESDEAKIDLSLQMLVINYRSIKRCTIEQKAQILKFIYENFINIKTKPSKNIEKLMDFRQDAAYVYSSFMMDYGIDLFEAQNNLDWRKFMSLLQGLSPNAKLKEVMDIRGRKVPAQTKYNAATIKALREAKAYYALEIDDDEGAEQFQKGLAKLAGMLEKLAGG